MFDKKSLGKRIKEIRKSIGLTQEKLAEAVCIDSKHLSRIECGINYPSIELLNKISHALNIETYMLFQNLHNRTKNEIIKDINSILKATSEDNVRIFYKILLDIVS